MNFNELVQKRRSIRKFTEQELAQDEVVALMRAALMSPSSHNTRGWQFVLVDDKNMLQRLSETRAMGAELVAGAALAVVVCVDSEVSNVWIEDAAIAAYGIQLQAEDLGLGSCWVQVRNRQNAEGIPTEDLVREMLNIPDQVKVLCMVAVGHKAMERNPQNEDKLMWEKVHIGTFKPLEA